MSAQKDMSQTPVIRISELIAYSPVSIYLPEEIDMLINLATTFEMSEIQNKVLSNPSPEVDCPALEKYGPEYSKYHERIAEIVRDMNDQAREAFNEIQKVADEFNFIRLREIAECPKEDCSDREQAQSTLGWQDGEEVLL